MGTRDGTTPSRWMRVAAAGANASFATFIATASHTAAGGTLPSSAAIAVSFALSTLVCIPLSGQALSLWRTVTAVAATQAIFHFLFAGLSSSGSVVVSEHSGHGVGAVLTIGATSPALTHASWMWLAHGAAAILTVVTLRYTEEALRRLRQTTGLFFGALDIAVVPVRSVGEVPAPRLGCANTVLPRDLDLLFGALRHRGPPASIAA